MSETEGARVRIDHPAVHPHTGDGVEGVALLTLDRPEVLNALDSRTMLELVEALERLDGDASCRAIVITGAGERAFAAGADIREMADATPVSLTVANSFARWERIRRVRTPIIAAVRGFSAGSGIVNLRADRRLTGCRRRSAHRLAAVDIGASHRRT